MKVLVTGCMGFIGSNVVIHLLNEGFEVLGFDNLSNPSILPVERIKNFTGQNWKNFKFYEVDIRNLSQMKTICVNEKPTHIVHLAALGSVPRSFIQTDEVVDVNIGGFAKICMLSCLLNIQKLVFASSSSVYGETQEELRVEGKEGKCLSPYALTKKLNEELASVYFQNINTKYIGLRFFNVYGHGQLESSPYSAVVPKFLCGKEIVIYGDGETSRDFTHVEDVAEAIKLALTSEINNDVFNVGTGQKTTLNELANLCKGTREVKHITERPYDVKNSLACTKKSETLLKFKASIDIKSGVSKTKIFYDSLKNIYNI